MWFQSFAVISLALSLSPLCQAAEINSSSLSKATATHAQLNPRSSTKSNVKPIVLYQQALNHLLGRNGATKSAEKAADIFKALAEKNWSSAQHMLGNMYYSGKGVEKNDLLAYKWLSLASKNNIQLAEAIHDKRKLLHNRLRTNLSDQSLDKVETWIAEWEPMDNDNKLQFN